MSKKGKGEATFHEVREQNLHQGKRLVIFMSQQLLSVIVGCHGYLLPFASFANCLICFMAPTLQWIIDKLIFVFKSLMMNLTSSPEKKWPY